MRYRCYFYVMKVTIDPVSSCKIMTRLVWVDWNDFCFLPCLVNAQLFNWRPELFFEKMNNILCQVLWKISICTLLKLWFLMSKNYNLYQKHKTIILLSHNFESFPLYYFRVSSYSGSWLLSNYISTWLH